MKTRDILAISASLACGLLATSVLAGPGPGPNPSARPGTLHVYESISCPLNLRVPILTQFTPDTSPKRHPWQLSGGAGAKIALFRAYLRQGQQGDELACGYGGPSGPIIYINRPKGCVVNSAQNGFNC